MIFCTARNIALTLIVIAMSNSVADAEDEIRLVLQLTVDGLRADLPARSLD